MQQVITLKKKGFKICISSRAPLDLKKNSNSKSDSYLPIKLALFIMLYLLQ